MEFEDKEKIKNIMFFDKIPWKNTRVLPENFCNSSVPSCSSHNKLKVGTCQVSNRTNFSRGTRWTHLHQNRTKKIFERQISDLPLGIDLRCGHIRIPRPENLWGMLCVRSWLSMRGTCLSQNDFKAQNHVLWKMFSRLASATLVRPFFM
jgi:hypothetical protein